MRLEYLQRLDCIVARVVVTSFIFAIGLLVGFGLDHWMHGGGR